MPDWTSHCGTQPRHQPAVHLVFAGGGKFLHRLRRAGREAIRIDENHSSRPARANFFRCVARRAGDAIPLRGSAADILIAAVVEVDVVTEIVGSVHQHRGVV